MNSDRISLREQSSRVCLLDRLVLMHLIVLLLSERMIGEGLYELFVYLSIDQLDLQLAIPPHQSLAIALRP